MRTRSTLRVKQETQEEVKVPFNPDDCIKSAKAATSKQIKKKKLASSKTSTAVKEESKADELFYCPICKKRGFPKAQALGGHMSKSHPNMSPDFSRKQQRRKERAPDRELLKKAKEMYINAYGPNKPFTRNKLQAFKNILREEQRRIAESKTKVTE